MFTTEKENILEKLMHAELQTFNNINK